MKRLLIATISLLMSLTLLSQEVRLTEPSIEEVILQLPHEHETAGSIGLGNDQTISIDFPNEDVRSAIRNIADLYDLNLVVPDTLSGGTSIKLRNVTWEQAFELILHPLGYTFEKDRAIVLVKEIEENEDSDPLSKIGALLSFGWILLIIPSAIIHIALALSILKNPTQKTKFMGRYFWAYSALVTGFIAFSVYWVIHHSTFSKK